MKLKLKESIRANGVQYLPPAVIDTDEIGITQADAEVLVRRGTAVLVADEAPAQAEPAEAAETEAQADDEAPAQAPAKAARKR